ncbi:hypothetical protein D3C76_1431120 [compost metagenome]
MIPGWIGAYSFTKVMETSGPPVIAGLSRPCSSSVEVCPRPILTMLVETLTWMFSLNTLEANIWYNGVQLNSLLLR